MQELLEETEHNLGPTDKRPGYADGWQLRPYLRFYMKAFWALSADRNDGGPIPWTAMDAFARRYGIEELESFERFCSLVRAMDGAYLDHKHPAEPSPK